MKFIPILLAVAISILTISCNEMTEIKDEQIAQYVKDNEIKDIKVSPDSILYTVATKGNGVFPKAGDYVEVHYTGTLLNGEKFDSSKDRDQPFIFQIGEGRVIKGWDLGIPLFDVGGSGKLYLTSEQAYGSQGAGGGSIPPNSPLLFDIEVLKIVSAEEYKVEQREGIKKSVAEYAQAQFADQIKIDGNLIDAYLAKNNIEATTTPSGLRIHTEVEGEGDFAYPGQTAVVHYRGKLLDGSQFDASYDRNQPFPVQLGAFRVIPGWEEGLLYFKKGGKGTIYIPSSLGYGPQGSGDKIPANSPLVFDIEILDLQ